MNPLTIFNNIRANHNSFDEPGIYTFLNPYSYLLSRGKNIHLKEFNGIYVDGILMVIFWNFFFPKRKIDRISFDMTSLADKTFKHAAEKSRSVYLIGAKKDEISKTVEVLLQTYPTLNIAGFRDGYFKSNQEERNALHEIVMNKPDIVIVGMGSVKQENFLLDLKRNGWEGLGFTCGGFLHQTSERANYYPDWINQYHLRWLYRLFKEKHARKRFLKFFFNFPFLFTYDALCYRLNKLPLDSATHEI